MINRSSGDSFANRRKFEKRLKHLAAASPSETKKGQ